MAHCQSFSCNRPACESAAAHCHSVSCDRPACESAVAHCQSVSCDASTPVTGHQDCSSFVFPVQGVAGLKGGIGMPGPRGPIGGALRKLVLEISSCRMLFCCLRSVHLATTHFWSEIGFGIFPFESDSASALYGSGICSIAGKLEISRDDTHSIFSFEQSRGVMVSTDFRGLPGFRVEEDRWACQECKGLLVCSVYSAHVRYMRWTTTIPGDPLCANNLFRTYHVRGHIICSPHHVSSRHGSRCVFFLLCKEDFLIFFPSYIMPISHAWPFQSCMPGHRFLTHCRLLLLQVLLEFRVCLAKMGCTDRPVST